MSRPRLDVVVVGGGPAGLSAALVLGRCRRQVVVVDSGGYRNAASPAMHGFLSRDGTDPGELRRLGRAELARYDTVAVRKGIATRAEPVRGGFRVHLGEEAPLECRRLLVATGMVDELPLVPGFAELYGASAFHCPYCDGWEHRDRPLAVYGRAGAGLGLALELTVWSGDVILCTDGPSGLRPDEVARLAANGIDLREQRIAKFDSTDGMLEAVVFDDGTALARRAVFFNTGERQRSELPAQLGCRFDRHGAVRTGPYETTDVPGLYVAGDASRMVQLVIVAAAEGAEAAFAINTSLLREDLR